MWIDKKKGWLNGYRHKKKDKPVERPLIENEEYGVTFFPVRCPRCKSTNVRCYASHPPVRYHKCKKCGFNFKSIEKD